MAAIYEPMETLIENTIMVKGIVDGVHRTYRISPVDGYLLHDNRLDWEDFDPETLEPIFKLGFTRGMKSCAASYNFAVNPFEFYAVLDNGDIPGDQIFGGANNDHEVM